MSPAPPALSAIRTVRLAAAPDGDPAALAPGAVTAAADRLGLRDRRPPPPARALARLRLRAGRLTHAAAAAPIEAARAALVPSASAPPRFLVRVDEFPTPDAASDPARYGTRQFARFHELMADAGVPYLLAVTPRPARDHLDPAGRGDEALDAGAVAALRQAAADGTEFAVHGYDHRTRRPGPRDRSELAGLGPDALGALLDRSERALGEAGVRARVFVPPFNHFDAAQLPVLARRYPVVCGGPETVRVLGWQPTPRWIGEAVYLPAYPPLYGAADAMVAPVRELVRRRTGLWTPLVLHWTWERDDGWAGLRGLLDALAGSAVGWGSFLDAVEASR
jgi:peptidoglycan/xylan/chitin deacetylase (PgdA/CDA1 family)